MQSSPKTDYSFWGFWWKGIRLAAKAAWSKYGNATRAAGLLVVFLALTVAAWLGVQWMGIELRFWITALIPLGVLVFVFLYSLARAPYEMYLELAQKHREENDALLQEIGRLNKRIHDREVEEVRQESTRSRLCIEDLERIYHIDKKYGVDVVVRNPSRRTADDVTVELLQITAEEIGPIPERGVRIKPTTELVPLHSEGTQQFRLATVYFSRNGETDSSSLVATLKLEDSPNNHYLTIIPNKEYRAEVRVGARDFAARIQKFKFLFEIRGELAWFEFIATD